MARKSANIDDVQVIRVKKKKIEANPAWDETKKLVGEIDKIALEIQVILDELAPRYKELADKIRAAYIAAPKKDCLLNTSPMAPSKVLYALKSNLIRDEMQVDNLYVGDKTKILDFKDVVSGSCKWLLKFS